LSYGRHSFVFFGCHCETDRQYIIALTAVIVGAEFCYLPMWFCSQVMLEKCGWTRNSCSDYICIQTIFWGWDRVWSTGEYKCVIIWCSHPRHSSCKNILFSHDTFLVSFMLSLFTRTVVQSTVLIVQW